MGASCDWATMNMPVRVTGTVLDSMTGNPVASATISTGDRTATAGCQRHGPDLSTTDSVLAGILAAQPAG